MRRSWAVLPVVLFLATSQAADVKPRATALTCASATGIRTEAEVVPELGIYTVNVVFVGKRPPNKEIDRVVRDCVSVAAKRDPSKDILGSPRFRKRAGDDPDGDELLKPWGEYMFLSYEAASKSIRVKDLVAEIKKSKKPVTEEEAFQKAIKLVKAIKATANDPGSIDVFDATYFDDGTVAIEYRGRNAFGALIVNRAVWTGTGKVASGSDQQVAGLWNKYVAGKNGHDLTKAVRGAKLMGAY